MAPYRDKDEVGRPLHRQQPNNWQPAVKFRRKKRTVTVFAALCIIAYLVLHSQWWNEFLRLPPGEDLVADGPKIVDDDAADANASSVPRVPDSTSANSDAASRPPKSNSKDSSSSQRIFNGPIKFLTLYDTISKVQSMSHRIQNRHVVFVAANMNVASLLAGVACEMSRQNRNVVHLALLGRNKASVDFFKKANGMNDNDCKVVVHDGRPDYAMVSTDERMELSVKSAIKYLSDYISPRAIITVAGREEHWFSRAVEFRTKDLNIPLITLPHVPSTIPWLSRLDTGSLAAWNKPKIEIVIHADEHSGQLIRLLKSLKNADYFRTNPPRLTIDLDPSVNKPVRDFINSFDWPSKQTLHIRHRILAKSPKQALLNFVESYYPNDKDAAVLFLNPNTELSPFYYHWLYYAILEYKYSALQLMDKSILYGIALDQPQSYLSGKHPFALADIVGKIDAGLKKTPYLYAAPLPHASLIFGQHWSLFHLYLSKRLQPEYTEGVDYSLSSVPHKSTPSWVPYFTELMTAGGYVMLYPNFGESESLVISHTESMVSSKAEKLPKEGSLMNKNGIPEQLPGGAFPEWQKMVVLDMNGAKSDIAALVNLAHKYRAQIVKCKKGGDVEDDSVDDLFCDSRERAAQSSKPHKIVETDNDNSEEDEKKKDVPTIQVDKSDARRLHNPKIEPGVVLNLEDRSNAKTSTENTGPTKVGQMSGAFETKPQRKPPVPKEEDRLGV